jgi:hypothetical protein
VRTIAGLWRWRRNPLRRRTDLAEAWVALTAVLLFALATPVTGWLCGNRVDRMLRETVRVQHEQRHRAVAVVVARSEERPYVAYDVAPATEYDTGTRVVATWRAPDGTARSGTVSTQLRSPRQGDTFTIWADRRGEQAPTPMDMAGAHVHAVLAAFSATALAAALVECGRRLVVWRLVQRRYQRLDRAWAESGPDWGRTGAGS